jgi:2,3-bisphosphoglycerate-dependent phosphoglycerate mutase
MMILDGLSPDEVTALELATGVPIVYELDSTGVSKLARRLTTIGKKILND